LSFIFSLFGVQKNQRLTNAAARIGNGLTARQGEIRQSISVTNLSPVTSWFDKKLDQNEYLS
jgi:hypothetical protein